MAMPRRYGQEWAVEIHLVIRHIIPGARSILSIFSSLNTYISGHRRTTTQQWNSAWDIIDCDSDKGLKEGACYDREGSQTLLDNAMQEDEILSEDNTIIK